MKILLLSDLHFTSKILDEKRFDLFPQIEEVLKQNKIDELYLLGDIMDKVDLHPGKLVNQVISGLTSWSHYVDKILILHGNHDSRGNDQPYLKFIEYIPKFEYVNFPKETSNMVFLPHSRTPLDDWKNIDLQDKICFVHTTVNNAEAESGILLKSSVSSDYFKDTKITIAGDIHLHQQLGQLIYVGSPYSCRFNSTSPDSGYIILDTDSLEWSFNKLNFPKRLTISLYDEIELGEYDVKNAQIKFKFIVDKDTMSFWRITKTAIEKWCLENNNTMCGFEMIKDFEEDLPTQTNEIKFLDFPEYCKKHNITGDLEATGNKIINEIK